MKVDLKFYLLMGLSTFAMNGYANAQVIEPIIFTPEEEIYIPREPTEKELVHNALVAEIDQKWLALFDDPTNADLHLDIAAQYNLLGNGDIALHELERAETLGIPREDLFIEIGKAYLLNGRAEDTLNEILIEQAPIEYHGEINLLRGHANYALGNMEEAFINYYQADKLLAEDRLELSLPLARLYSLMGDYEKAEANVEQALKIDAKNVDAFILKGNLVHRKEGAESSFQYFEKANFYRPDDLEIETKLAGALYSLGRTAETMIVLRKMLAKQANHPFANFMIAVLFADGNNIITASRYLKRAGDAYNDFVPGLLLKGKLGYATGSYDEAETSLSRLISIEPDHIEARRILGAVLIKKQKPQQAVRVLKYLADNNRLQNNDVLLLGNAYMLAGDNDKGTEYLYRAVDESIGLISEDMKRNVGDYDRGKNFGIRVNIDSIINQNTSSDHRLILQTYRALSKKQYDVAFTNAAKVLDQNRRSPIGYNLLGLTYIGQNKTEEARSNFRRASQLDPAFHQARINLAKLEFNDGNQNAAINNLNAVLAMDQGYVPAYILLFEMAMANGDMIRAERYLITATSAQPGLLSIREKLINFYFSENNLTKASNLAMRMVERFPDHALPYKVLGKVNLLSGDMMAACDNLQQSLLLNDSDDDVYLMLAAAFEGNNERIKSRPLLKRGLHKVSNILPLQQKLVELAGLDGNFTDSYRFVDQLKLSEDTKAMAFLYQGELNLLQNNGEGAALSFKSAAKAGANAVKVLNGLDEANALLANIENNSVV